MLAISTAVYASDRSVCSLCSCSADIIDDDDCGSAEADVEEEEATTSPFNSATALNPPSVTSLLISSVLPITSNKASILVSPSPNNSNSDDCSLDSSLALLVMADRMPSENWSGGSGVGILEDSSYSHVAVALVDDKVCLSFLVVVAAAAVDASASFCRAVEEA